MSRDPDLRFISFLGHTLFPFYQGVAEFVGARLDLAVETVQGASFDEIGADGRPDAAFICGLPYVELVRRSPPPVELLAAPVLAGERYGDRPIYFSDVIVRRDRPWRCFDDLRGRSWAYNEPGSHSGYNVTRHRLIQMGATGGFFSRVTKAGSHHRAVHMVRNGEVDASAIDSHFLAGLLRAEPELEDEIRIIDVLGPSTGKPVVIAASAPESLKAGVRTALLAMDADPGGRRCLARGLVVRFAPITDGAYDDIRMMLDAAQAAGFLTIR